MEDEGTEDCRQGGYYAVRVGDAFKQGTYIVQSELGRGYYSTVWLARDTVLSRDVALKVQKSAQDFTEVAMDEIEILKQIADGDPDDTRCVVKLLDHFEHSGPNCHHVCMVFEVLGDNLATLIQYTDCPGIPLQMVKEICRYVLIGLAYLHQKLSIIHTDLKPENIVLVSTIEPTKGPRLSDVPPYFPAKKKSEDSQAKTLSAANGDLTRNQKKKIKRKTKRAAAATAESCEAVTSSSGGIQEKSSSVQNDRIVAADNGDLTRNQKKKIKRKAKRAAAATAESCEAVTSGSGGIQEESSSVRKLAMDLRCKLVDFGTACWTNEEFTSYIETSRYQCPEVHLGSRYSTNADLWSFACICFELATGNVLFNPLSGENYGQDEHRLALMMELLGKMPREIALGGRRSSKFFNRYGDLKHIRRPRFRPLDKMLVEKYQFGERDATDMADFLLPILDFVPEKRPPAAQLLLHPWLEAGPRIREPSDKGQGPHLISDEQKREQEEREAMAAGLGNIFIDGSSSRKDQPQPQSSGHKRRKTYTAPFC